MRKVNAIILTVFSVLLFSGCALTPTPLIKASFEGRADEVKSILAKGTSVDERGTFPNARKGIAPKYFIKSTPLMAAAHYGQNDMVSLMLDRGADINAVNFLDMTPLHQASYTGQDETVSLLIKRGAKVNVDNSVRFSYDVATPLACAAYFNNIKTVKLLVANGADINAPGSCNATPLWLAAIRGNLETVEYLVKSGADMNVKINEQFGCPTKVSTPLKAAEYWKRAAVVKFLKDAEAGKVTIRKTIAAPPEDPAEVAAFEAEAKRYRELAVKPAFPEEARKYKAQAEFAFQQKRFEDAVALYDKALKAAPWWPDGHFNRALILGEISRYEEAIREMKKYLLLAPDAADAGAAQDRIYQWESVAE